MSASALFGLAGFFLAFVVHAFLLSTVLRRSRRGVFEKCLIGLLGGLLFWFGGNFLAAMLRQMDLAKVGSAILICDALAFTALSGMPALLLHTHWIYYRLHRRPGPALQRTMRGLLILSYGSLLLLPLALTQLLSATAIHPFDKLGPFRVPFLALLTVSYFASAYLQLLMIHRPRNPVESSLFRRLLILFITIPLFTAVVFEFGDPGWTGYGYLVTIALLASVFPSLLVAYFVYRYQFLQLPVHRGLISGLLILLAALLYLLGTRSLGAYLEKELSAPSGLLEFTLLAGILLLFFPVSRWLNQWVSRSFLEEMERFRSLAERIHLESTSQLSLEDLKAQIVRLIRAEFPECQVRIDFAPLEYPSGRIPEGAIPLEVRGELVGVLQLSFPGVLTPGTREGIRRLAEEIATASERCRFLDRQLQLERDLSLKNHLESLGRMAATIAHNVKNPLSSIKTLLQLQLESSAGLSREQKEEFTMMLQEIDRLDRTVSNLLKFSRLGLSGTGMTENEAEVFRTIESVIAVFRGSLAERRLKMETELSVAPNLRFDEEALRDILTNLIGNAIDASPEEGTIRIHGRDDGESLFLLVEDEGLGIPSELGGRLFEPFVSTKSSGTGLGLAIVQERVNRLRGEISFRPGSHGRGVRFEVRLPLPGKQDPLSREWRSRSSTPGEQGPDERR